jgi:hypothetical protein
MSPRPATTGTAGREPTRTTVLRGRRLFLARRVWIALAALTLGLFFASIPAAYERYRTACESSGCDIAQLSPEGKNALTEGLGLSMGNYAVYTIFLALALALGHWLTGGILFWKRSDDPLVLYASMTLVTFGAMQADTLDGLAEAYPIWDLPVALVYFVGDAFFFVLFCVFPDGRFVPPWTRWAAAAWIVYRLLYYFFPASPLSPDHWPALINGSLLLGLIASLVLAQIYRYRRVSGKTARQQTKWVVFGFAAAFAMFFAVQVIGSIFALTRPGIPELFYKGVGNAVITLCALLIPLSISFAILRYRLWDIDLIINRALVYGSLSAVLATVFAVMNTLLLPSLVQAVLGKANDSLNVGVSAVIIAVLFEPLRRRIQDVVNRLSDRLASDGTSSETLEREKDIFIPPPSH